MASPLGSSLSPALNSWLLFCHLHRTFSSHSPALQHVCLPSACSCSYYLFCSSQLPGKLPWLIPPLQHCLPLPCLNGWCWKGLLTFMCVYVCVCVCVNHSVVSDFLQPYGLSMGFSKKEYSFFSRGSSRPRDRTQIPCTAGGFFTIWATREASYMCAFFLTQSYICVCECVCVYKVIMYLVLCGCLTLDLKGCISYTFLMNVRKSAL